MLIGSSIVTGIQRPHYLWMSGVGIFLIFLSLVQTNSNARTIYWFSSQNPESVWLWMHISISFKNRLKYNVSIVLGRERSIVCPNSDSCFCNQNISDFSRGKRDKSWTCHLLIMFRADNAYSVHLLKYFLSTTFLGEKAHLSMSRVPRT